MENFVYINDEHVLNLLNWNDVFEATKTALMSVTIENGAIQNPRAITENASCTSTKLITMPACLNDNKYGALACKLITLFPNNNALNPPLPSINAIITLFDEKNGSLKALIEGREITKWRTAAASVIATKYLTNGKPSLAICSILGSGEQGRIHAEAFHHFFNFQQIRIWNHRREHAEILVNQLNKETNTNIFHVAETSQDCVKDADVIVTATLATQPIVELEWLKAGVHINAVGVTTTQVPSELSSEIYLNADVFIDHWDGAKSELKPLELMGVAFEGVVGELITGKIQPPPPEQTTIFESLGMAVEDCAVARLVYDKFIHDKKQTNLQN